MPAPRTKEIIDPSMRRWFISVRFSNLLRLDYPLLEANRSAIESIRRETFTYSSLEAHKVCFLTTLTVISSPLNCASSMSIIPHCLDPTDLRPFLSSSMVADWFEALVLLPQGGTGGDIRKTMLGRWVPISVHGVRWWISYFEMIVDTQIHIFQ